jgi:hypothetical protein
MIRHDMIPEPVWHTAMSTYHKTIKKRPGTAWQEAIAAALAAWPGVDYRPGAKVTKTWRDPGKIILPLPQETSDE